MLKCNICDFTVEDESKIKSHNNYIHQNKTTLMDSCDTTDSELKHLEETSWEEQRIYDQQMETETEHDKNTNDETQNAVPTDSEKSEDQIREERSRLRDEQITNKAKKYEEEETEYQEKMKKQSGKEMDTIKKKSQKKRKKKTSSIRINQTSNLKNQDPSHQHFEMFLLM